MLSRLITVIAFFPVSLFGITFGLIDWVITGRNHAIDWLMERMD